MKVSVYDDGMSIRRRLLHVALSAWDAAGFNRLCRALTRQRVRVLMYHGVSDEPMGADYWLMVSKSDFEWQMSYLSRVFEVAPWTCLLEHPSESPGPARPRVVITFDDAYSNLNRNAGPALTRLALPSVCFVIPDLSERGEEVWTTKLFRLLLESDSKRIPLEGVEPSDLILPLERQPRHEAARRFINDLKHKSPSHIQRVMDIVSRECEPTRATTIAHEFALMSIEEVLGWRATAAVTIGSHSNSHYSLSTLGALDQEALIAESLACLRRHGIEPAGVFAYPSGHYTRETVSILKKHGVQVACTTEPGLFGPGDDPLSVRRIAIGGDMTRVEFKYQTSGAAYLLARLLGGAR